MLNFVSQESEGRLGLILSYNFSRDYLAITLESCPTGKLKCRLVVPALVVSKKSE